MTNNFILYNKTAQKLYKEIKDLPIIDYHCHLNAQEIFEDKEYQNITQMWLYSDHYKWRLMRQFGIEEKYITGNAKDEEKFENYLKTIMYAINSPLYHWSKMELEKYFNVKDDFLLENIDLIYQKANQAILANKLSPQKIIASSNVEVIATIEDVFADLKYHKKLKENNYKVKVLPIFRADKAFAVFDKNFKKYIAELVKVTNLEITDLYTYQEALKKQITNFINHGCNSADFSFEGLNYIEINSEEANQIFKDILNDKEITNANSDEIISYLLKFLFSEAYKNNLVVQIHIGAIRNNNERMFSILGVDSGYDSISNRPYLHGLIKLLNQVNPQKTIIFNLNPSDNAIIATLTNDFAGDGISGKVQMGAAWWFNDTLDGMRKQMDVVSNMSHLATFNGMLTDSRSILSYPRHDYFRRLLCSYIGEIVEKKEFTNNFAIISKIAKDISYYNVKKYFQY